MTDAEDMAARGKRLAQQILDSLDEPTDPTRLADLEQKDQREKDSLERFYIVTGQRKWVPAPVAQGPQLAAWDYAQDPPGLAMYMVGSDGGKRIGYGRIEKARRDAVTADLRKWGVRVGGCYGSSAFVWVADEYGATVWSKDDVRVEGTRAEMKLPGRTLKTTDVTAIVSFVGDDYVQRGVRAVLRDGREVTLVDEHDDIAKLDPTFGRNEFLASDARWIGCLGRDVAASLRVPHRDEAFGSSRDHAIASALQDLADRIRAWQPVGAFEAVEIPLTTAAGVKVTLRFAAMVSKPEGDRIAEVVVATPSGESTSTQWLTHGPNDRIVATLRLPDTADRVALMIDDLSEALRRHRFQ